MALKILLDSLDFKIFNDKWLSHFRVGGWLSRVGFVFFLVAPGCFVPAPSCRFILCLANHLSCLSHLNSLMCRLALLVKVKWWWVHHNDRGLSLASALLKLALPHHFQTDSFYLLLKAESSVSHCDYLSIFPQFSIC